MEGSFCPIRGELGVMGGGGEVCLCLYVFCPGKLLGRSAFAWCILCRRIGRISSVSWGISLNSGDVCVVQDVELGGYLCKVH